MAYTQEQINQLFHDHGIIKVTFIKKDKTKREMVCTKNLALVPDKDHPKSAAPKVMPPGLMNVYELDNGWRSFHCDSVIDVEVV